jgi:hypothetical protein
MNIESDAAKSFIATFDATKVRRAFAPNNDKFLQL